MPTGDLTAFPFRCTCPAFWHGVVPPPPCHDCQSRSWWLTPAPVQPPPQPPATVTWTWTATWPPRLSDEDVARIADEVVRRLREGGA